MTELAVPEAAPVATQGTNTPAPAEQITTKSALVIWAEEARVVANIAVSIAKTPFAGALRGKPEEVTAVILAGNELGLKPMAALKSVDVIQGQPALRAHAMRGLLQSKGHEIELVESDDAHCVMRGRRKGSENWQTVTWDIPRARLLGLLNKDQWKKQPKTMLIARATGELARLVASDVLHGMPYAAEELDSQARITVQQVAPARPLSVAALTSQPSIRDGIRAARAARVEAGAQATTEPTDDDGTAGDTGWQPDSDPAPHEWDIHTLAATLGMSDADLDERCHRLTGAPLATATPAQISTLTQSLANEMVALDNAQQ